MLHLYEMNELKQIISNKFALEINEKHLHTLKRLVNERASHKNLMPENYIEWLVSDEENMEWQIIIDSLTVKETYFFRNKHQFDFFQSQIIPQILEKKGEWRWSETGAIPPSIRILSAGCSTGEEPYSIAMCFAEKIKYLNTWDIRIDAFDISESRLRIAQKGYYKNSDRLQGSFLETYPNFLRKYFDVTNAGGYQIKEKIKDLVVFKHLNLKQMFEIPAFLLPKYDVIFCRNVMIYFNYQNQTSLVQLLEDSLEPNGYLMMGDAETLHLYDHNFELVDSSLGLIYQKSSTGKEKTSMGGREPLQLENYEFVLLRDFIAQHFGIHFEEEKKWLLESKLSRLMQKYTFDSFFDYYNYLMQRFFVSQAFTDPDLVELIGSVSNNETYFCREAEAFQILKNFALPQLYEFKRDVRILCAGCSTGEEAYTLAITVLESGRMFFNSPPITAVDVDFKTLETAKAGLYRANSFRRIEECHFHNFMKYFEIKYHKNQEKTYSIKNTVKSLVTFQQINLLDEENIKDLGRFDVIFCRNVIIYFSDEGKEKAIENLAEILNPGGFLFLGHSESIIGKSSLFNPMEQKQQIFYQKK